MASPTISGLSRGAFSAAAASVWAKHDHKDKSWLPLWRHLADSAAVAGKLWDAWLPRQVSEVIAAALPGGADDARTLAVWLAGVHDLGKATPAFACQVNELADAMRDHGFDIPTRKQQGDDRKYAPHGLAGQALLQQWLTERHGWKKSATLQLTTIVGGHHGIPPTHADISNLAARPALLYSHKSEPLWRSVQGELLDTLATATGATDRLSAWQGVKLPQPAQVLLAALVIVADWIASNRDLFPYDQDAPLTDPNRLTDAWQELDLPRPWEAVRPPADAAALFAARFDLPAGATVRPVQEEAVRAAGEMAAPGMLLIEAPMGEGKTEAALAAAEILAARTGAGGCFVALPTMATSNAMFRRVTAWLERLPDERAESGAHSVELRHSKSALNADYARLPRRATNADDHDHGIVSVEADAASDGPDPPRHVRPGNDSAEMVAHHWLRGRKKGMLASFVVGTIDQLLFAGLKSRHLALRHLAIAGKVVVIDEAHAYDTFMSTYLDRVLSWLGTYQVPVVVLSATLPAGRRRELAEAYARGGDLSAVEAARDYPLLTTVSRGQEPRTYQPAASGRRTDVQVERLDDDLAVLAERLATELGDGGCAVVVRNTVARVHETARYLREYFAHADVAVEIEVAHARFVDLDRAANDERLRQTFGPPEKLAEPGSERPTRAHIVVASQVVEQSLDIDFDLMVTDLAPIDLLLQRMGRLHRHQRERPERLRTARCLVTGADWMKAPPEPVRGSRKIYHDYPLLRAAAVLEPFLSAADGQDRTVRFPDDISPLVQRAYGDGQVGPPRWQRALDEAYGRYVRYQARQEQDADVFRIAAPGRDGRSLVGWVEAGVGDADDTPNRAAQVRDTGDSIEVLVVRERADGTLATLPDLDAGKADLAIPENTPPPASLARTIAQCALRLPFPFTLSERLEQAIAELETNYFPAWQDKDCHWLAGQLILVLDENCQTRLAGCELTYSRLDGLEVRMSNDPPTPSFDLTERRWVPVQKLDGTETELSLRQVFAHAAELRRVVGDLPTQEFALLRLLLAILHDAIDGPEDLEQWQELWEDGLPLPEIANYLDRHRDRFDLLHPTTPFFQVADLHTAKGEISSLDRVVADVPNGAPFFTMRARGADRVSFAEAARWVVHAHAYDPSGIKSGAVGDSRVKNGKGYPQGLGWAGNLGGVFVEGENLRQTLLLNLVAADTDHLRADDVDRPAWRFDPPGAAPLAGKEQVLRPYGVRDLYTWQSRRLRLRYDADGVYGVLLCYGDPLAPHNMNNREPMTAWRRSKTQESKLGKPLVYLPQEHHPARSAWRGLASLIADTRAPGDQRQEAASRIHPRVLEWAARLGTEGPLEAGRLIRARLVGAVYGTQQSVIDEVVDDQVDMAVALLHDRDFGLGREANNAVEDAEDAVKILGNLAADLARAVGAAPDGPRDAARDRGFGDLDGPFRDRLTKLGPTTDPQQWRADWRHEAYWILRRIGDELVEQAGEAAWTGRVVELRSDNKLWLNSAYAESRFRRDLGKRLNVNP